MRCSPGTGTGSQYPTPQAQPPQNCWKNPVTSLGLTRLIYKMGRECPSLARPLWALLRGLPPGRQGGLLFMSHPEGAAALPGACTVPRPVHLLCPVTSQDPRRRAVPPTSQRQSSGCHRTQTLVPLTQTWALRSITGSHYLSVSLIFGDKKNS